MLVIDDLSEIDGDLGYLHPLVQLIEQLGTDGQPHSDRDIIGYRLREKSYVPRCRQEHIARRNRIRSAREGCHRETAGNGWLGAEVGREQSERGTPTGPDRRMAAEHRLEGGDDAAVFHRERWLENVGCPVVH